jgi:adenylate kinase family enzyme
MSPNHLNGHVYDTINIIGYPGSGKGTLTKGIKAKNLPLQELVAGDVVSDIRFI